MTAAIPSGPGMLGSIHLRQAEWMKGVNELPTALPATGGGSSWSKYKDWSKLQASNIFTSVSGDSNSNLVNNGMTLINNDNNPIDPHFTSLTLLSQKL